MYAKVLNLNSEQKIPQSYPLQSLEKLQKNVTNFKYSSLYRKGNPKLKAAFL